MKTSFIAVILGALSLSSATALASEFPAGGLFDQILSDSGIRGKPYNEIIQGLHELQRSFPLDTEIFTYGTTINRQELKGIKIKDPLANPTAVRPFVVITGATHGNENLEVEPYLAKNFLERKAQLPGVQSFLRRGGVLYIVPVFNPDGYSRRVRENSNGTDLNRDFDQPQRSFLGFAEAETREFVNFMKGELERNQARLAMSLDYHCCEGALLYPWSYTRNPLDQEALRAHQGIGQIMRRHLGSSYVYGITGDVLGYFPVGTSKDYYYTDFGALAFTFEGKYQTEKNNLEKHVQMWNEILNGIH